MIGYGGTFLFLGFFGKFSDQISVKTLVPAAMIIRAILFFAIHRIDDPFESWYFFLIFPITNTSYYSCNVFLIGYL
jgi:hypothetical protein